MESMKGGSPMRRSALRVSGARAADAPQLQTFIVVLHERLQQSADAEQLAPAARQAQRPLEHSIRPQHWLLSVQVALASRQHRDVVGDARYDRPEQHAPPLSRGLPATSHEETTQEPPLHVIPAQQRPGSEHASPATPHASETHVPLRMSLHE